MFDEELRYSSLSVAAEASSRVGGLTHGYYRYPARFGETFVRQAISQFSRPGDIVLDPFCGGGTTVVEALASGRRAVGSDLSQLALFVTRAKTTPLSEQQLNVIRAWVETTCASTRNLLHPSPESDDHRLSGLPQPYRNLLASLRYHTTELPRGATTVFAKCLLLNVAQWAFDGKEHIPKPTEIVARLRQGFTEMLGGMREYNNAISDRGLTKQIIQRNKLLCLGSASQLTEGASGLLRKKVSLVVTSPPYLGVHVLYNRWQLQGRRELKTPFFLSDCQDIGGSSAYTIIDRKAKSHAPYYSAIQSSFGAVGSLLAPKAYVIQLVSFSNSETALPHYLTAMKQAGLELCETYMRSGNGLQWRLVPGRRWYVRVGAVSDSSASKEVLLVHRKGR